MRTSDERLQELHRRMAAMKNVRIRRTMRIHCAAVCTAALAAVLLVAFSVANTPVKTPDAVIYGTSASIFADHGALGYIVVSVTALCLGVLATILCFRLKARAKEKEEKK